MLINGQPVYTNDVNAILYAIHNLQSGLTERTAKNYAATELSITMRVIHSAAHSALSHANKTKSQQDLAKAESLFKQAVGMGRAYGDLPSVVMATNALTTIYQRIGNKKEALSCLKQVTELCQQLNIHRLESHSLGQIYALRIDQLKSGEISLASVANELTEIRARVCTLIEGGLDGENQDHEGYLVSQREYGISNSERMGTKRVSDCVAMILREPNSHWASLSHIDYSISPQALKVTLDGIGDGAGMPLINAHLFGAKMIKLRDVDLSEKAKRNIKSVIEFMLPRNINVVSSYIFDPQGPSCIAVDPRSGKLTEVAVIGSDSLSLLRTSLISISNTNAQLKKAFDLTQSEKYKPIFLSTNDANHFTHGMDNVDEVDLFKLCCMSEGTQVDQNVYHVLAVKDMCKANNAASRAMTNQIDRYLHTLMKDGLTIEPNHKSALFHAVYQSAKFVGPGADERNEEKVDYIRHELTSSCRYDSMINIDLRKVTNFSFG
ncbi:MAG: hypothetical protein PHD48_01735 [Alphaproteobacteria bacterium]|nr:hypothetical protein [Alphaproteobacteria bacterium]